jgi:hypothetical protein
MPIYAKLFEDSIFNRRSLEEVRVLSMSSLSKKLNDPGKFSIPCSIGKTEFGDALCDLGASVSLMPKSIFDRIGVGELKPIPLSLQLADGSIKIPLGIVEDIPVQIGKFLCR